MNPPEIAHTSPSTSSQLDAKGSYLNDYKLVVLDRARTLLLMCSVVGCYATRGAFTGAMARQFAKADDKTTIDEMVIAAKIDMKKNEEEGYNQSPEARNTLQKNLILPPVNFKPDSIKSYGNQSKRKLIEKLGVS